MNDFHPGYLLNAVIYAVLGIFIFVAAFWVIDRRHALSPLDEIECRQEPRPRRPVRSHVDRHMHHHRRRHPLTVAQLHPPLTALPRTACS